MADAPYLIAMALMEQNGSRTMPLQGQSLREPIAPDGDPGEVGRRQALELMLRVWQRSDQAPVQRAAGNRSLLLAELPIEALTEQLPRLKAAWLNGSGTDSLIEGLTAIGAASIWSLEVEPRTPLVFERVDQKPLELQ